MAFRATSRASENRIRKQIPPLAPKMYTTYSSLMTKMHRSIKFPAASPLLNNILLCDNGYRLKVDSNVLVLVYFPLASHQEITSFSPSSFQTPRFIIIRRRGLWTLSLTRPLHSKRFF